MMHFVIVNLIPEDGFFQGSALLMVIHPLLFFFFCYLILHDFPHP